jgi:hypothetical protein
MNTNSNGGSTKIGAVLTVLISSLILWSYHGDMLSNANTYNWGDDKDGLKNCYTFLYHVKHDSSLSRFEGMNYPYGEQVVFTDNQPTYSNLVKVLHNYVLPASFIKVGLIYLPPLLHLVLTSLILFLILRHFGLPVYLSIILGIGVSFINPQLARFNNHHGLSYSFIIPLVWLFLLKVYPRKKYWHSLLLGVLISAFAGLHFYYFAILSFFLAFYLFWDYVVSRDTTITQTGIHFFSLVVVPFLILQIWLSLTDNVTDRPKTPFGFLAYRAYWEGLLIPIDYPLGRLIKEYICVRNVKWGAVSYVGICASLFTFYLVFRLIRFSIQGRFKRLIDIANPQMKIGVLTGVSVLLFSLGFPFVLGLEWAVEYMGPLKQFRSIARFSWVFYHVINVYCFWWCYKNFKLVSKTVWFLPITFLVPISFMIHEVNYIHSTILERSEKNELHPLTPTTEDLIWLSKIDPTEYQAIIPIPYFHIGNVSLKKPADSGSAKSTFKASYNLGLPITGVMMSRTSSYQTVEQMKFALPSSGIPNWVSEIKDERNFLILVNKTSPSTSSYFLEKSMLIFDNESIGLYKMSLDSLLSFENNKPPLPSMLCDSLILKPGLDLLFPVDSHIVKNATDSITIGFWLGRRPQFSDVLQSRIVIRMVDQEGKNNLYQTNSLGDILKTIYADYFFFELTAPVIKNTTPNIRLESPKNLKNNVEIYNLEIK